MYAQVDYKFLDSYVTKGSYFVRKIKFIMNKRKHKR